MFYRTLILIGFSKAIEYSNNFVDDDGENSIGRREMFAQNKVKPQEDDLSGLVSFSSGYNHRQNHDHTHKHKHGHKHAHEHAHQHSHTQTHNHVADHNHDHAHVHHHKHNHIHGHDEDHKHAHTEGHVHSHKYAGEYEKRRRNYEQLAVDHTKNYLKTYMGSAYKRLTGY